MFTRSDWFGTASSARLRVLPRRARRMRFEGLEPRLALAADPQAVDDIGATPAGMDIYLNVLANDLVSDTGEPLDPATLDVLTPPSRGTLDVDPVTGIVHYTPDPFFTGIDTFTYQVRDNSTAATREERVNVVESATASMAGAEWKYLDDGSDQGTSWVDPNFNDSAWTTGRTQFGYGDGDEDTVVNCGPTAPACTANNFITTYFRHKFQLGDLAQYTGGEIWLKYDDGLLVHLNGQPFVMANMQFPATYTTPAQTRATAREDDLVPLGLDTLDITQRFAAGENTLAVEVHQNQPGSSDISFDLALFVYQLIPAGRLSNVGTVTVNVLDPNPTAANDSAQTLQGEPVVIDVLANDAVGINGNALNPATLQIISPPTHGTTQIDPQTGAITYLPEAGFVGTDTLSYQVQDTATENGFINSMLLPRGSTWKYLDNGTDPGTTWRQSLFDDSAWASGPAELGYGDGGEATVIDCGPGAAGTCSPANGLADNYITTYFRRTFTVPDPALVDRLSLLLRRDDGAIVYINGREVARQQMPIGAVTPTTLALEDGNDGTSFFLSEVVGAALTGLLVSGENTIAVEVHQEGPNSSDISFDLELIATEEFGPGHPSNIATVEVIVTPTTQTGCQEADLNRNGQVGNEDLALFVRNYGATAVAAGTNGDLDRNGRLGLNDLRLMRTFLGQSCSGGSPAAAPGAAIAQVGDPHVSRSRPALRALEGRAVDRAVTVLSDETSRPVGDESIATATGSGSPARLRASRRSSARNYASADRLV